MAFQTSTHPSTDSGNKVVPTMLGGEDAGTEFS